jgi:hypothetical protein
MLGFYTGNNKPEDRGARWAEACATWPGVTRNQRNKKFPPLPRGSS